MTSWDADPPGEGVIVEQPSPLPVHLYMHPAGHGQPRLGFALALTAPAAP